MALSTQLTATGFYWAFWVPEPQGQSFLAFWDIWLVDLFVPVLCMCEIYYDYMYLDWRYFIFSTLFAAIYLIPVHMKVRSTKEADLIDPDYNIVI